MTSLTDIFTYWQNNSVLIAQVPFSQVYQDKFPERYTLPFAIIGSWSCLPDYTTGDPYVSSFSFNISVWTNNLNTTNLMQKAIDSQFTAKRPVAATAGCWQTGLHLVTEENQPPKPFAYGAVLTYRLDVTSSLQNG